VYEPKAEAKPKKKAPKKNLKVSAERMATKRASHLVRSLRALAKDSKLNAKQRLTGCRKTSRYRHYRFSATLSKVCLAECSG
jgi:hypothetical protein